MRTGLLTKKLGMSSIFNEDGSRVAVTLLQLEDCHVVSVKSTDKDGYNAVQLGVGNAKAKNVSKAVKGHHSKSQVPLKVKTAEFRVDQTAMLTPGSKLDVNHFIAGQFVDITGTTVGKGFSGVMKRWNFRGLEASHGVSVSHRSHGSTGQRQDPGKVFKGKKMAGHYGDVTVTIQNLQVLATDVQKGLLMIKGAVPGHKGGYVLVRDAVKRALPASAPYPASIVASNDDAVTTDAANAE